MNTPQGIFLEYGIVQKWIPERCIEHIRYTSDNATVSVMKSCGGGAHYIDRDNSSYLRIKSAIDNKDIGEIIVPQPREKRSLLEF